MSSAQSLSTQARTSSVPSISQRAAPAICSSSFAPRRGGSYAHSAKLRGSTSRVSGVRAVTSRCTTTDRRPEFVLVSVRGLSVWCRLGVGASVWRRLWRSSDSRRTARRVAAASWRSMSSMRCLCSAFALPSRCLRAALLQPCAAPRRACCVLAAGSCCLKPRPGWALRRLYCARRQPICWPTTSCEVFATPRRHTASSGRLATRSVDYCLDLGAYLHTRTLSSIERPRVNYRLPIML